MSQGREFLVYQPVAAVFSLRPGIREIDVKSAHTAWREEVFQKIAGFDPDTAEVLQAYSTALALEFVKPA